MRCHKKHVVLAPKPKQADAQKRALRQVERPLRLFVRQARGLALALGRRQAARSTRGTFNRSDGTTTWTGWKSITVNLVRSVSWRRTISLMLRSSASTSSAVRKTQRRVQVEQPITRQELIHEPQPLLGKRERKNKNFLAA